MCKAVTSVIFLSALVACSLAAPALRRSTRQVQPSEAELMSLMRSGLRVLQEFSKYNLSKTLMINATLRVFDDTDYMPYKELQEALNTTCKLHESKNTLASITLDDQIAYQILSEMSEKSLEDACTWTTTTLANIGSSYAVECSNSSLTNLCSQWNDVVGIKDIEKKVEILANATSDSEARSANAGSWIERQMFENESPLFDFFSKIFGCSKGRSNISC